MIAGGSGITPMFQVSLSLSPPLCILAGGWGVVIDNESNGITMNNIFIVLVFVNRLLGQFLKIPVTKQRFT